MRAVVAQVICDVAVANVVDNNGSPSGPVVGGAWCRTRVIVVRTVDVRYVHAGGKYHMSLRVSYVRE